MKLPKCPHCGKLMASVLVKNYSIDEPMTMSTSVDWLCPERVEPMKPEWVDVEEQSISERKA